mmetsp:Transcript_5034/g.14841  ORF Transcript_5034/g.14841 Transcript_5034/m.14841 type:complete len:251 (+) Transcript_5034:188-940(+)
MVSCKEKCVAFLPALLSTVAIICGLSGTTYCETIKFPVEDSDMTLYSGIWNYRTKQAYEFRDEIWVYTTCRNYKTLSNDLDFDYEIDAKTRTAMSFTIIAGIIGGLAVVFTYFLTFTGRPAEARWKALGSVFIFTSLLQGLTLVVQGSSICKENPIHQLLESLGSGLRDRLSDECEWGPGYKLIIVAVVFWFVAGASMYILPPPQFSREEETQNVTVTYQKNPDGTVTETGVTVVKGAAVPEQVKQESEA